MRVFDSGATRDSDDGKLDYEGFLHPLVLQAFAEYMHKNRIQSDGSLRDSDNWQKGIPQDAYMKSLLRHVFEVWICHRVGGGNEKEALCATMFNTMGKLLAIIMDEMTRKEVK